MLKFSTIAKKARPIFRPGKERSKFRRFVVAPVAWLCLAGFIFAFLVGAYFNVKALGFSLKKLNDLPQRTLVFDRKGEPIGHVAGHGENRVAVTIAEVSPHFQKALLAREDSRFYKHGGVDFRGVVRAMITNLKSGDIEQGASTITMQLARNTWGLRRKTLARKLQEVAMAHRLERRLSKDEILEHYMNRIYFGYGLYGIERAAQAYFEKPAAELTLGEGAMLAGVIRGPSLLNPFRDLESAEGVRDEVLDRMVAEETITLAEADAAKKAGVNLRPASRRSATGSYVLSTIHDLLGDLLQNNKDDIAMGSLRIYTTIDQELQEAAQRSLDSHLTEVESRSGFPHPSRKSHKGEGPTKYVQGAVVSLDNQTGAILALVGGRDYGESPFNRALNADRQCGSTFKPFVYAAAFDIAGLMPGTYISDDPIRYDTGDGKIWSPQNSDGQFKGNQRAALGLINSRNTMTIRVGELAGLENVRFLADQLQMGTLPESPVSYLGAFDTTLMTMTSAYSTFPAKGVNYAPYLIERIESADGHEIFKSEVRGQPIFRKSIAWLTSDVLEKTMTMGTGRSATNYGFKGPGYGKTGTTNDYRDAWFVGFTDKITTGVWVGMDQPKTIMNRGYGSTLALPIWAKTMAAAEKSSFPAAAIERPEKMVTVELCAVCGELEQRRSIDPYRVDLPKDLAPRRTCDGHGSRGGIFDLFSRNRDSREEEERRFREAQPRGDDEDGGVGNAIRGIGRFIFGPSQ